MKKIFILMLVLIAWTTSLSAQVTHEQANEIVMSHIQEASQSGLLYLNVNSLTEEEITITTSNEETVRVKYPCWAYYLNENPGLNEPSRLRYLLVKKDNGSLLEILTSNDYGPGESTSWEAMDTRTDLAAIKGNSIKLLYLNPVGDLLTLPCNGNQTRIEIYDLKGTRLFSGQLSGKDTCQLDVSFLNTGIYIVSVSGETYKMIKN